MADSPEKLGTLQYEMTVSEKSLEDSLKKIDALLIATDKKWKDSLSNMGSGSVKGIIETQNALIELARSGDATVAAGKKVIASNADIETSYENLKVEIKEAIKKQEELTVAQKSAPENQAALASLQKKIDLYAQFKESLNEATKARKQEDSDAKRKAINDEREIKRLKELTAAQDLYRSKLMTTAKNLPAGSVERSSAYTKVLQYDLKNAEDPAQVQRLNQAINAQDAIRKRLITTQKEQKKAAEDLFLIQKLQAAVDAQSAGSIGQLRAQYALLRTQLSQVKFSDPNAIASVQKLQTAISGVKSEIQALQPTLGIWGKLKSAILTYATAYVSVQGIMGLGRAAYNQTKELDSLNFSMKTVIKSSTELAQTQKFLADVAVNYGGDLLTLSERYIKFRAAAVQSNVSAGETQKIFESVSKAAGTLGLKTDELSGVYLALEQMLSKGKVTTEELRRQLGERLPGAFGIMANALGVTIPELDKLLKKGEILSTVALPKFAAALEKAYGIESLKKIDTLAAAQGRLSTEFTGLIKGLGASDAFKGAINGLASLIGFFRDYMGVLTGAAKLLLAMVFAQTAWKLSIMASVPIQRALLLLTGNQTSALGQLSFAQKRVVAEQALATAGTTLWAKSWKSLQLAFASNPLGLILTGITLVGSAIYMLVRGTKSAKDEVKGFADNLASQTSELNELFSSLRNAAKGSNELKDAMFKINNLLNQGGFLDSLLTENNYLAEQEKAYKLLNEAIFDQILLKEQQAEAEKSIAKYTEEVKAAQKGISEKPFKTVSSIQATTYGALSVTTPANFGNFELTASQQNKILMQVKDTAEKGLQSSEAVLADLKKGALSTIEEIVGGTKNLTKEQQKDIVDFYSAKLTGLTENLRKASDINKSELEMAAELYRKKDTGKPEIFNVETLKNAKEEFEKYAGLIDETTKKQFLGTSSYVSEGLDTYEKFLRQQLFLFRNNQEARVAIENELSSITEKRGKAEEKSLEDRRAAITRLNDKYLADQEDFANYEMGIQSTRIANMEDGLDKEIKINELAYENRIKAIEKEKIATVKLLNEAAGVKGKIVGFDATGYSKDVQDAATAARDADLQKRKNAENDLRESNLRAEKDYQIKINELRRDANDQFLSGLEKERAAINEKYDEWVRKAGTNMKLIAEIEKGRDVALSEIYIQNQIDQLDFMREIEYKKNEIKLSGSSQQRKLEKENFEIYVKYERERIKLLKSSVSVDKQREGFNKEQQLDADKKLFNKKQEKELESKILEGAQKISEEYIKQAGLTGESAENLQLAVSTLQSIAKGDYLSAALGVLSKIFTSFSTENENEMLEYFEQLKVKISAVVDKVSTLNSVLAKMGSTSSVIGVKLLQSEMSKLANDAARLNEQLKEIADSEKRRGSITQGATTNGSRSDATEIESSRKRIVTDLIKQTDYLNQQIIMLSNKLLDPNLTEDQRKAVESVLNGYIEIVDAIDASIQSITGTSINELSNSIVDAFLAGENAAEAWGNKVTDIIRYMVKQQLVAQLLTKPITQAIQTLVADSEDTLTPEEALKFKDTIRGITEDVSPAIAAAAEAMKQVGIDLSSTSAGTGISKGIQALTEDTGRRLEGLINSIRESSVINIGNTKQLVESSQMIQGYAAQSLGELRMVNTNLATQIGIFNDWTTTTNGTGGKGIKVYVQ